MLFLPLALGPAASTTMVERISPSGLGITRLVTYFIEENYKLENLSNLCEIVNFGKENQLSKFW